MEYSKQLKHPKWQKKRLKILERDNFTCVHCGDTETTLNVHHKKYTGMAWDAPDENLETVCEDCHFLINDIESIKNNRCFNCIKINKTKHNSYFVITFILGDCEAGKGAIFVESLGVNNVSFLKEEDMKYILNTINNE